jgi:hypothetical protein
MTVRTGITGIALLTASALGAYESYAGYYFAIAVLATIYATAICAQRRSEVPQTIRCLLYFALLPLLFVWAAVEILSQDASLTTAKAILLVLSPWVLIASGYEFATKRHAERTTVCFVIACTAVAATITYVHTGYVSSLALLPLASIFVVAGSSPATLVLCAILPLCAVFLTDGGSRTVLALSAMQGAALLITSRSITRQFGYAVIGVISLVLTAVLITSNELFAAKLSAGLAELAPDEYAADRFGGGSNLRGYEAALVMDWLANAEVSTLLFGGGPSNYLDSIVAIAADNASTRLFVFHNALLTYLVKLGLAGTAIIVASFTILSAWMTRRAGIEGAKVSLMIAIASLVGAGSFSHGWITLFFATGVFMRAAVKARQA